MEKDPIRIFESVSNVADFALHWLSAKTNDPTSGGFLTVALSGGSTPKQLFEYVASHEKPFVNWNTILFFWGDERCVSPDHGDSNYRMTRQYLFEKLDIPEEHIFRIYGEAEASEEARRYSRVLSENVPLKNGLPCFDLILLGLGEDGHTASIFPGNERSFQSDCFCEAVTHPQTGQQRITLTGSVINNAADVAFLVTGTGKAGIVSRILNDTPGFDYPAAHVHPREGSLTWLLDTEAAVGMRDCRSS
jgi:6-phosphogluconolactonase